MSALSNQILICKREEVASISNTICLEKLYLYILKVEIIMMSLFGTNTRRLCQCARACYRAHVLILVCMHMYTL